MSRSSSLVLINGTILTMDAAQPRATAVGVRDGRVVVVGDDTTVRAALPGVETVDLRGRTALPGFNDAHLHLLSYCHGLRQVNLYGLTTIDEALRRARAVAQRLAPGDWLLGRGWRRNDFEDRRLPTRADLDAQINDRPVGLRSHDGHSIWCNSRALALADITAATADPPGGRLERDEAGQPTGILYETAIDLVERIIPPPSDDDDEAALRQGMATLAAYGITSVGSMEDRVARSALQRLHQAGDLSLRVYQTIPDSDLDAAIALGIRTGLGDEWLRIGHLKIFSDGALGSRTAWMAEPYTGQPENRGIIIHALPQLRALVERAARAGIPSAIHAIGDQANHEVLEIFAAGRREGWLPAAQRPRIEHVQVLLAEDRPRLAELGVIASMQPIHCTSDMRAVDENWGERGRYAYLWRTLWQHGTVLAFGSDAPVEEPDVIAGLHAAVTRQNADGFPAGGWYAEETIPIEQALWAYTVGAAQASQEEHLKGSLRAGQLGDITVLSDDPTRLSGPALFGLRVEMTIAGGRVVYRRD